MGNAVILLDGGTGKLLHRMGAPFRQPEWSALALMEAPARVVEAHRLFIEAGADVVTTNNYAVVPYHLGPVFDQRGAELVDRAGALARRAADAAKRPVLVAGSLPPLFGSYLPDRFDPERGRRLYGEIVEGLDPHVDLWLGETLSRIDEMWAISEAVRAVSDQPLWISFTLPEVWDPAVGLGLRSGETIEDLATAVAAAPDIEAVLFNCSTPEQTGPALQALRDTLTDRGAAVRLGAYANAFPLERGPGYAANTTILEARPDLTPDRYARFVDEWIDLGASIVGGCCEIYPEHIAALDARRRQRHRQPRP